MRVVSESEVCIVLDDVVSEDEFSLLVEYTQRNDYVYVDATAEKGRAYTYRLGLVVHGEERSTHEVHIAATAPRFSLQKKLGPSSA